MTEDQVRALARRYLPKLLELCEAWADPSRGAKLPMSAQEARSIAASLRTSLHTDTWSGADMIAAERARQCTGEGWTREHDESHADGALADAAECYLHYRNRGGHPVPVGWPWGSEWWKVSNDPVRNLVKAGALIAAEIDRLRASLPSEREGQR